MSAARLRCADRALRSASQPAAHRLRGSAADAVARAGLGARANVFFLDATLAVVFEGADLARLERTKATMPGIIQELIFHPNARLASTWQPWDGVLGPPENEDAPTVSDLV